MFLLLIIGNIGALDTESSQFVDYLITRTEPSAPEIIGDGVLFTFPTEYRSVGIAFAHEEFARIYWFRKLLTLEDQGPPKSESSQPPPRYTDPQVLFFAYTPPEGLRNLEYRLVVNGLWTTDPLNPLRRVDRPSGISRSVVILPELPRTPAVSGSLRGALNFTCAAEPGETITVAGDFNGWDPFMYELEETSPGRYGLVLPLPPGTYRYVFYQRGERRVDPNNPRIAYDLAGGRASEAAVE